jgi:hypothetical protein
MNATAATAAEIASYIEENDVSLESVASMAGTSPKRMSELQVAQCIPVHTYEVRCTHTFSSSFGDHAVGDDPQRYYHPSVLSGLKTALERADKLPLSEVAQRFRSDFEVAFDAALAGRTAPWPGASTMHGRILWTVRGAFALHRFLPLTCYERNSPAKTSAYLPSSHRSVR